MENSRIKRKKRRQSISLFTNIVFCMITLAALTGCIVLLLKNYALRNQTQETMAQIQDLEKLQDMFVSAQSADIDGVSGCTLTSDGAIEAVQAALDQAQ